MRWCLCALWALLPAVGLADDGKAGPFDRLTVSGDLRVRAEQDWASRNTDGSYRRDRFRGRYRFRLAATWDVLDALQVGARVRTGVPTNAQSPHFNFGYLGAVSKPLQLDRAYARVHGGGAWAWAGKHGYPFWRQNEYFWDDDVQLEGLAAGGEVGGDTVTVGGRAGAFMLSHDHAFEVDNATMVGGQLVASVAAEPVTVTVASAALRLDDVYNVPETDPTYTDRRFRLDYTFVVSGVRLVADLGPMPLAVGADHMVNLEDYSDVRRVQDVYVDQRHGLVGSLVVGELKDRNDLLFGYWYVHKERFSVVDYFTEDDVVRWGNIHRNRNTNYRGHEVRAAWAIVPQVNLMARFYTVFGLVTTGETTETGNRLRVDCNVRF